jgi:hypothetical protein
VNGDDTLLAFNRGVISRLALARLDLKRPKLSAEEQTNWMARSLGPMSLRPGLKFLGGIDAVPDATPPEEPVEDDLTKGMSVFYGGVSNPLEESPDDILGGENEPRRARDAFLDVLTEHDVQSFEGFSDTTVVTGWTTAQGIDVTCEYLRVYSGASLGRYPVGGSKYVIINPLSTAGDPATARSAATFDFDPPCGAFGFFAVDCGDVGQIPRVYVTNTLGETFLLEPGVNTFKQITKALAFVGVVDNVNGITQVVFACDSANRFRLTGTWERTNDIFEVDMVYVAPMSAVDWVTPYPDGRPYGYPSRGTALAPSWPDNQETIFAFHFDEVYGDNRFWSERRTADATSGIDYEDSVADSTAAGTWVQEGLNGSGAYKNVGGARINLGSYFDITGAASAPNGWALEGRITRKASATGTGEFLFADDWIVGTVDGSGKMHFKVSFQCQIMQCWVNENEDPETRVSDPLPVPGPSANGSGYWILRSDSALPLDTAVHWRLAFCSVLRHELAEEIFAQEYRVFLYIGGARQTDKELWRKRDTEDIVYVRHYNGQGHTAAAPWEECGTVHNPGYYDGMTAEDDVLHMLDEGNMPFPDRDAPILHALTFDHTGTLAIGGRDGSNYTLCVQDEVRMLNGNLNLLQDDTSFTPPTTPFTNRNNPEIYTFVPVA